MANAPTIKESLLRIQELTRLGLLEAAASSCVELAQHTPEQSQARPLALTPSDLSELINCARLLCSHGKPQGSLELVQIVLAREPTLAAGWVLLGNALITLGELAQAEAAYRRVLDLVPRHRDALHNLALALFMQLSLAEAETRVRQLLAIDPQNADEWLLLGGIQEARGQSDEAITSLQRSVALQADPVPHSTLLSSLQYVDDADPIQLLHAHRQWDAAYAQSLRPASPSVMVSLGSRPLRLGFLSADFTLHPTGFLVLPGIECLDKSTCSVICYSDRLVEDEFTVRFRATADVWRPISGLTDEEVAEQIRQDKVDVLVDLKGHVGVRLLVFARKPAPVQITWFGYVGTTGMSAMDFLLADRFHVREGEELWYTETVLRMPNGYACYGPPADGPDVGPLPALGSGRVTFGCFNKPHKYTPRVLDTWAEILRRLPTAQLLLKYGGLDDAEVQARIRGNFAERGIAPERILMEGWSPFHELVANYNRVDLALDTQPYSGGLTTCEALWMGVPVITYPGKTFAGRHSVSHLTNAGYELFIAADLEGYVELAVEWANRLDELAVMRSQMRERVRNAPLCDAPRFARDFLAVLHQAWES